jgi:hypothetical protein
MTCSGFASDGSRATDAASLAVDGAWHHSSGCVQRGAVGGILGESPSLLLAVVHSMDAKLVCTLQQVVMAGADPMQLLLLPSLVGVALSERVDSCCDGGSVFTWDARERSSRRQSFSRRNIGGQFGDASANESRDVLSRVVAVTKSPRPLILVRRSPSL